jgi:hypothetical protein
MVLMKDHGPDLLGPDGGFVFYTNSHSRKGGELLANPRAAMLFHWKSLRRQIRIEGAIHQVPDEMADAYFASRSRDLQLGAHASNQSAPLASRGTFIADIARVTARHLIGRCRARRTGRAFALCPRPWSSGWTVRSACMNAAVSRVRLVAGPARCFTRKRRNHGPTIIPPATIPRSTAACYASITMALLLVGLKGWAAWSTGSTAMLGSLADTGLDLVASIATLAGVWVAGMPADDNHRFGHGKAEALSAMFQVMLIAASSVALAVHSVQQLASGERTGAAGDGILVSAIAIVGTLALLGWQQYVIRQTRSVAISTDHLHYKSTCCSIWR